MNLIPGSIVDLQCLGTIPGPKFLDGRTGDGTVGLAPVTTGPYTGTRWQVEDGGGGAVVLKCLGNIPGPVFLDGRTGNGTVGLAPSTSGPYTGTRWQPEDAGGGAVILKCLGDIPGPVFLDGRTADGTVGLAPATTPPYSGTRWNVLPVLTLDQQQLTRDGSTGATDQWQSFTAGHTGLMSRLDVMVSSGLSNQPQTGSIKVYSGDGVGGAVLSDQSFAFQPVYNTFQQCSFPTPFSVVAGQMYTFRLTIPVIKVGWIYTAPASAYPRGHTGPYSASFVFKTWVMTAQ